MHHSVRQVEEEGLLFVGFDEFNRLLGVALGEQTLVGLLFDDLAFVDDGERRVVPSAIAQAHVIGIGNAPVGIEAVLAGQPLRLVA